MLVLYKTTTKILFFPKFSKKKILAIIKNLPFSSVYYPENSRQIQHQRQRYPCNVCGKSYLRKAHLKRHMTCECIGVEPKFWCEYCSSRYKRKEDLKRHILIVHKIDLRKHQNIQDKYSFDEMPAALNYNNSNSCAQPALPVSFNSHSQLQYQHHSTQHDFNDPEYIVDY